MNNTYTVYHKKQKIVFSSGTEPGNLKEQSARLNWEDIAGFLKSDKSTLRIRTSEPARLFRFFSTYFECVAAAGGLVENSRGNWLFIYRNGRWDLPKGMAEPGEFPENTALREVKEECGIRQLNIQHPLPSTYHIYPLPHNDIWALKKTKWFMMATRAPGELRPQTEEGITCLSWKDPEHLREIFENTHENIKELLLHCQELRKRPGKS